MSLILIVWIFVFIFVSGITLIWNYWEQLISIKVKYKKNEVSPILKIIAQQWNLLIFNETTYYNTLSFFFGLGVSWLLAILGGVNSKVINEIPAVSQNNLSNYFFPSILFSFLIRILWPLLNNLVEKDKSNFMKNFCKTQAQFFFGLNISLSALNLTNWGIYHQLNFFYVIIHSLFCISYTNYIIKKADEDREISILPKRNIENEDWEIEEIKEAEDKNI